MFDVSKGQTTSTDKKLTMKGNGLLFAYPIIIPTYSLIFLLTREKNFSLQVNIKTGTLTECLSN